MTRYSRCGRIIFVALSLGTASLLAGCSGIKPYPGTTDNNLHLRTVADTGSLFSSVRAALDIYHVGTDCSVHYEGTVQLNHPTMDVGIPPNRWTQLVFVFASSSFWRNRSGTITYDTLLKPKAGSDYGVIVSYKNDMYHVVIKETSANRSSDHEIEQQPLSVCRSSSTHS